MKLTEKIKKSWWVFLSAIIFINGFGFIYIGFKHNNKNWILEGLSYEFPWFFYFIVYAIYGQSTPSTVIIAFAVILLLISIIRSIWVAIKLADVYDNSEKYTIKSTVLDTSEKKVEEKKNSPTIGCCICIAVIFIIFAIIAIL